MSTVVNVIPVVGLPTLTGWSQVVHSHVHQLVCALAIDGPGAHNVGRDLVDALNQAEPVDSVTLHQLILDLLAKTRKAEVQLQLVAILYKEEQLIMAACHGQILYRKPSGQARLLLTADAQPQLIEGKLNPGSTLIAMTDQVGGYTDELLRQLESGWEAERLVTNLLPKLHSQPDSALSALACVAVLTADDLSLDGGLINPDDEAKFSSHEVQPLSTGSKPLAQSRRFLLETKVGLLKTIGQKAFVLIKNLGKKTYQLSQHPKINQLSAWQSWPKAKKIRLIGLMGTILATAAILFGLLIYQNQIKQQKLAVLKTEIEPAETLIQTARQQLESDPISARDKTNQAVTNLMALQQKYPKPAYLNKPVTQALDEAKKFAQEISGLSQLQDLNVFFDLRLAEPNFIANTIIVRQDQAYFFDQERKHLVKLDLSKKQSQSQALAGLAKLTDAAILDQNLYFLGDGLTSFDPSATEPNLKALKPAGDSDRDATAMESYASYLYLLNPTKRNIFRLTVSRPTKSSELSLSEPIGWIINKKGLDFESLVSLAVDGDVWLAAKDGKILKYTQGQPINWEISGLKTAFSTNLLLATNDQLSQLYVLEPDKRRLVVLNKSGQFLKELQSPTIAAVTSFDVSETLQKAFLVSGSTVYELSL